MASQTPDKDAIEGVSRTNAPEGAPQHHSQDTGVKTKEQADPEQASAERVMDSAESSDDKPSKYDNSRLYSLLTPKNVRWSYANPPKFTLSLCILYAFSATFTVANLYYCQPILPKIARTFSVSYESSSQVATLMQAGYAAGLILVLPMGDLVERRTLTISLVLFTATVWIGLCITPSFMAFRVLSFVCGLTTVTPQLMIPLVGDFAPPERRGFFISIVVSGLVGGMLVARLLSGVVANFTSWRNIYWFSCGAQYVLGGLLFWFMPDYPSTNPEGLGYFKAMISIPYMMLTEPLLIQASLIAFCLSSTFTSFWTTMSFLLSSDPYNYSTLVIGLFSLLGLVAITTVPLYGRIIDRFIPLFSVLMAETVLLVGVIVGTFIGTFTVAGPIIQAVFIDLGVQISQVANRASIFNINPKARNRVNTAYMATSFSGQLTGTAVGNRLYAGGGWRWSSGASIGFAGLAILIAIARGPRERGWVGWAGGWRLRKDTAPPPQAPPAQASPVDSKHA